MSAILVMDVGPRRPARLAVALPEGAPDTIPLHAEVDRAGAEAGGRPFTEGPAVGQGVPPDAVSLLGSTA